MLTGLANLTPEVAKELVKFQGELVIENNFVENVLRIQGKINLFVVNASIIEKEEEGNVSFDELSEEVDAPIGKKLFHC
jgi:hypothetical protein